MTVTEVESYTPMSGLNVLLDNGIISGAELAEGASRREIIRWGDRECSVDIVGYQRRRAIGHINPLEIDAIVTIGRLIREKTVKPYTYSELRFEQWRRSSPIPDFNALYGCKLNNCPAAVDRSKLRQTIHFSEYIAKGGIKDKKGRDASDFNQLPFLEWLLTLDKRNVATVLAAAEIIGLTIFEQEILRQLEDFRLMCQRAGSRENYVDMFHVWTAERNRLDVFLTLDTKLIKIVKQIKASKSHNYRVHIDVVTPLTFLAAIGVHQIDDVPIVRGHFYELHTADKWRHICEAQIHQVE